MLDVSEVCVSFGLIQVLKQVTLCVNQGEIVTVIGSNGAGKSTLLNTIAGIFRATSGSIIYKDLEIGGKAPESIVKLGISLVCQGGRLFKRLTVLENLEMGAYLRRDTQRIKKDISALMKLFPMLERRLQLPAQNLSGGERQLLAISRSLMSNPYLLMMDEPTFGLAPLMVKEVARVARELRGEGKTILIVEQNANMALKLAERGYVFEVGRIAISGECGELLKDSSIKKAYLGQ